MGSSEAARIATCRTNASNPGMPLDNALRSQASIRILGSAMGSHLGYINVSTFDDEESDSII